MTLEADPAQGANLEAYHEAVVERALPLWADDGFDRQRNRFRERLDWGGKPVDVPHRSMVQARQIYVFAHAAKLGWFPDGGPLAEAAMSSLIRTFGRDSDGTTFFLFSADENGSIVSDVRDAYAHAFVLFAIASLYQLNNDPRLLDLADRIVSFIDRNLEDPSHGGLFDSLPLRDGIKRQNPLMHLLEAYLFLDSAASGRGYIDRASAIIDLFKQRLFKAQPGVLLEYFEADWRPHPDPIRASVFEPGHHFEWVWLLDRFEQVTGADQSSWIEALYRTACESGFAPNQLILDEVDTAMLPVKCSHRVWPHTEAIKAAVARHERGDRSAAAFADRMAGRLLQHFLDRPFAGGWLDHLDRGGRALVDYVPASSLYHLFLAATEAMRITSVASRLQPTI
ncbi:AGE family epimerase/isomerase [Sphingomonas sp. BIUV-7]|uniref:AGE family epimerase/isomerase n=1 Tax=Sphingomonas natans TaxID=3063330 RepID=A0ABT8Y7H7_9SPHN|nr:AGE family epimerase/isomerase [Sphingomonas sp. BIUV-7]MDO6413655.1 AGE family epimerase/isomerase [Sphingomonas sp. BIUV-7]